MNSLTLFFSNKTNSVHNSLLPYLALWKMLLLVLVLKNEWLFIGPNTFYSICLFKDQMTASELL